MIAYGIGILPLIRELRDAHPHVTQPLYADNAGGWVGGGGDLGIYWTTSRTFKQEGYFLDPTKSILVVDLRNVTRAEEFFRGMGVKIVTGSRYLGGFVGDRAAENSWLTEKVQG